MASHRPTSHGGRVRRKPLLIGAEPLPTPAYLVSMLMGVGFAIAGAGLLRSVAEQRRQARRAQAGSSG